MPASAETYDVVVVGGGPSGATAAHDLAKAGRRVLLLDKAGRIKPCGGAIPPRLIRDFDIPDHLLVARATSARMIAPSAREVDMPIEGGFVGMVDRDVFDEWLRARAASAGAERRTGTFERIERDADGGAIVCYRPKGADAAAEVFHIRARSVIGADGARSPLARQTIKGAGKTPCVFAYHEIVRSPTNGEAGFDGARCDVFYQGRLSPDFYAWIFPHGDTASIGVGSAHKGFSLRGAVKALRATAALQGCETIRTEGAPIPLKPLKRWDNGRDIVLAGDAAGVVAPASGEGIYYAMLGGRHAAEAADQYLATGDARALRTARQRFMKAHGQVFWVLGMMQHFWYRSDKRREGFVKMCADPDVQRLTWQAYMNKELVRADPAAHLRIFLKDMGYLLGLGAARSDSGPTLSYRGVVTDRRPFPYRAVLVAAASALTVAAIGGSLTAIGPWYRGLHKPGWTPPDVAFGVIWTTIFAFIAVSGVTAWRSARAPITREWIIGLFALNGFLNILWSLLFFRLQRPDWALIEVAPFWLSIAALIVFIVRFSRAGGLLLAPYLVWVSIASVLNYQIVHLNGPFG